jgi:hypothetical protein
MEFQSQPESKCKLRIYASRPTWGSALLVKLRSFTPGKLGGKICPKGWQDSVMQSSPSALENILSIFDRQLTIRNIKYEWNDFII